MRVRQTSGRIVHMRVLNPMTPSFVNQMRLHSLAVLAAWVLALSPFTGFAEAQRNVARLDTGWEYYQGRLGSTWEIWRGDKASDNVAWTPVALPHCFNARDAVDPDAP